MQVGSHAVAQLATGVRGGRLGPRGDGGGGGVARLQGKPAGLGGLRRAELGIAEPERCGAAERERLGQSSVDGRRLDSLEDPEGAGRIAELDLGECLLCPDLVRCRLADDARRSGVGRRCAAVPERVQRFRSQAERVGVVRFVIEQGSQVNERIGERPEPHRLPGRGQEPVDGLVRTAAVEPVTGDQTRRRIGARQASRRVAMDGEPLVRRELLDQGLADQLVTEPVARAGDDEDPRAQRDVEQRERLRFRGAGQRHDAGGIEIVARQRQPPQHRHRVLVEVEEPGGDGVSGRRDERRDTRDGALGQLEREEGIALREIDDPIDDLGGPRRRRARRHERGRILTIERPEVDLHGLAAPRQPRHSPGQDLGCRLRAVREHRQDRGPAGGAEVVQDIDRGFVREVRVVDDQRDRGAIAGGQEQTAERTDHPVASERALERRGRRGQRGQLGQHRARPARRRRRAAPGPGPRAARPRSRGAHTDRPPRWLRRRSPSNPRPAPAVPPPGRAPTCRCLPGPARRARRARRAAPTAAGP